MPYSSVIRAQSVSPARKARAPEHVVVDVVAGGLVELRRQVAADLGVLALQLTVPAEQVDGAPLGHGRQPGTRVRGHTGSGPLLQGRDQGVLGQFLGQADVAGVAGQRGDQAGPLDPDHRVDRRVRIPP